MNWYRRAAFRPIATEATLWFKRSSRSGSRIRWRSPIRLSYVAGTLGTSPLCPLLTPHEAGSSMYGYGDFYGPGFHASGDEFVWCTGASLPNVRTLGSGEGARRSPFEPPAARGPVVPAGGRLSSPTDTPCRCALMGERRTGESRQPRVVGGAPPTSQGAPVACARPQSGRTRCFRPTVARSSRWPARSRSCRCYHCSAQIVAGRRRPRLTAATAPF